MQEELTTKMHSEFTIDAETEISHIVGTVVEEIEDGPFSLNELLLQYNIALEQYEKHRAKWEGLSQ